MGCGSCLKVLGNFSGRPPVAIAISKIKCLAGVVWRGPYVSWLYLTQRNHKISPSSLVCKCMACIASMVQSALCIMHEVHCTEVSQYTHIKAPADESLSPKCRLNTKRTSVGSLNATMATSRYPSWQTDAPGVCTAMKNSPQYWWIQTLCYCSWSKRKSFFWRHKKIWAHKPSDS